MPLPIDSRLLLRVDNETRSRLERAEYERQPKGGGPRCPHCGKRYLANNTKRRYTHYYPDCDCAPPGGIKIVRRRRT